MSTDQGNVLLFQTNDGGDISINAGLVQLDGGLETAAYLSLFGGDENDDGSADSLLNWWGNIDETEPARQYRSETQYLLRANVASTAVLRQIEDAAVRDLAWMIEVGMATSVSALASIPGLNQLRLVVDIEANGEASSFEYFENWKASI